MKKHLFSFLALGALLCSTGGTTAQPKAQLNRSCFSCDPCCPKKLDPIVGVWLCNTEFLPESPDAFPGFIAVTFNADGTLHLSNSVSLSQPTPFGSAGNYGSLFHGIWKKTAKRKYQLLFSNLVNMKDTNDPLLPGIPLARIKIIAEFELDLNNQSAIVFGTFQFFQVDDLTLTMPLGPPAAPFAGECLKLNFD